MWMIHEGDKMSPTPTKSSALKERGRIAFWELNCNWKIMEELRDIKKKKKDFKKDRLSPRPKPG